MWPFKSGETKSSLRHLSRATTAAARAALAQSELRPPSKRDIVDSRSILYYDSHNPRYVKSETFRSDSKKFEVGEVEMARKATVVFAQKEKAYLISLDRDGYQCTEFQVGVHGNTVIRDQRVPGKLPRIDISAGEHVKVLYNEVEDAYLDNLRQTGGFTADQMAEMELPGQLMRSRANYLRDHNAA